MAPKADSHSFYSTTIAYLPSKSLIKSEQLASPPPVVGIDPDCQRLQLAKEKYSASNLEYIEGSGDDIPGTGYDIIFANGVLHWCPDKDHVFKQVAQSLKGGGKFGFVIVTADFDTVNTMYLPKELFSPECRQHLLDLVHLLPTNELLTLLIANNFKLKFFKEHLREWRFSNAHELIKFHMLNLKGFDKTHINIEAFNKCYGEGDIVIQIPCITIVAELMNH